MYEVKVNKIENPETKVFAMASIVVDESFVLNSIKIIKSDNPENKRGFFLGMPSYKLSKPDENGKDQYKEHFHPVKKELIEAIYDAVSRSLATGDPVKIREGMKESFSVYVKPADFGDDVPTKGFVTVSIKPEGSVAKEGEENVTDFVIDSIRVNKSKDGNIFVAPPASKNKDGEWKDLCFPITKDFRDQLYGEILEKYDIAVNVKNKSTSSGTFVKGEGSNIGNNVKGGEFNEGFIGDKGHKIR